MRTPVLLGLAALSLSACASTNSESQIRRGLVDAGVSPPVATCMADRLSAQLSPGQLRRLAEVAQAHREELGRMSVDQLLRRSTTLLDPQVSSVVTRAGIGCAIAG